MYFLPELKICKNRLLLNLLERFLPNFFCCAQQQGKTVRSDGQKKFPSSRKCPTRRVLVCRGPGHTGGAGRAGGELSIGAVMSFVPGGSGQVLPLPSPVSLARRVHTCLHYAPR